MSHRFTKGALLTGTVMTGMLIAAPAMAQDAPVGADGEVGETIIVTGSRIAQPNLDSTSPVAVTTAQEIAETGFTRLEDVLVQLPQVEAAQNAFISNGATGTATLDLRGLGAVRTLVLVNGRRLQPGSVNSTAADINQIPGALVQRIDVLTGGASSVYGADAVAGVVNFVMNDRFEGFELSGGISAYQTNNGDNFVTERSLDRGFQTPRGNQFDGQQYNVDLTIGGAFGEGGHAVAYAGYRKIDPVFQGDRDHSVCALNGTGTGCGGSYTAPVANFYISPIVAGDADFGQEIFVTLDPQNNFVDSDASTGYDSTFPNGPANIYNFAPVNYFQRPDERYTLGAFVNYEISSSFNPFVEVMYMNDRSVSQIAESGTFFADYTIACDSPLLTAEQTAQLCGPTGIFPGTEDLLVYIGKRNVEGGGRQNIIQHDSFRAIGGARGSITDNWSYEAYAQFGQSSLSDSYVNDFFLPSIEQAVDLASRTECNAGGDCIPYLVFQRDAVTQAAADNLSETATRTGVTKEFIASGYVTGDLGFGIAADPISVVFGAEYRNEVYRAVSDYVYENGLLAGQGGPTPSVSGKFDVAELFTEAQIPLLQDMSFAQDMTLELGYRYSSYDIDGGSTFDTHTYKAQLNWLVNDFLRLRGGYNRAVRAPNAPELFTPQSLGLWGGVDPCAGIIDNDPDTISPSLTEAECALTGVLPGQYGAISPNSAAQYSAQYSGSATLEPEKADTYTVGAVITPTANTSLSVDYYQIQMKNVIDIYPQEQLIRDCGDTGDAALCDRIVRGPSGDLWRGTAGYVISPNENLASRDFRGIDVAAATRFGLGAGSLSVGLTGSYLLKKEYQTAATTDAYDCEGIFNTTCFVSPNWRHTFRVAYQAPEVFTVAAKWRYFGSVDAVDNKGEALNVVNGEQGIDAYNWFDLSVTADVTENFSLTATVNNMFDKDPPLVGGNYATNGNTYAGYYDTLGRYLSLQGTVRF